MAEEEDDEETGDDNQFQACFLLRRDAAAKSPSSRSKKRPRGGRRLQPLPPSAEHEPAECGLWRAMALQDTWGRIEDLVKRTLEKQNVACFQELEAWVHRSSSSSCGARLGTATLFFGSVDSSDCGRLFDGLVRHLSIADCHVARLVPRDLLNKTSINAPLRCLLKQFLEINPETTDMEILAAWHREPLNSKKPMVVVIEEVEQSNGPRLAEVLLILSEWAAELPILLILGMATTKDCLKLALPSRIMGRLQIQSFTLAKPLERLEAVFQAVLVESPFTFCLGRSVAELAYETFSLHDNSVVSFLRLLKVSLVEHFYGQPLSFLCQNLQTSKMQADLEKFCGQLPGKLLEYASALPSASESTATLSGSLWSYKVRRERRTMAFKCLLAAGRRLGLQFHDILLGTLKDADDGALSQVAGKSSNLPLKVLAEMVNEWMLSVGHDAQCRKELERLQAVLADPNLDIGVDSKPLNSSPRKSVRSPSKMSRRTKCLMGANSPVKALVYRHMAGSEAASQKPKDGSSQDVNNLRKAVAEFLEHMRREFAVAVEDTPFHEVFCFKDATLVKAALTGETRKSIHLDLLDSQKRLGCSCCPPNGSLSSSLHDTSIAYIISQEHNELINVHDWYRSFETVMSQTKASQTTRRRSSKRKMSFSEELPATTSDANDIDGKPDSAPVQARFSKAVAELHLVGLARLPKKRHPDSVQRVAFGL